MVAIEVIGHSAVTCLGRDMDSTWDGLVAGRSGIGRRPELAGESYLQDIAGMVDGLAFEQDPAVAKLEARSIHLAMASARQAWADAGLEGKEIDRDRVAVVIGSALGGMDLYESETARMARRKSSAVSPYLVPGLIINQAAGQVAQHLGLHGPSIAPANACASGGHAIAVGAMFLRSGEADIALCGAAEAAWTPQIVNGFATMKALLGRKAEDRSQQDPAQASRPFSADRAGFVLAEGAGMVILATRQAAERLGLRPQARLLGWAMNSDGHHMAMPHAPKIQSCLRAALARAEVSPGEIDYYNAHGTSTKVNDKVETESIKEVFGDHARRLAVSSIKGALGHSLGAASAIEAAACIRALTSATIPPTINHIPDPELDLDYVPNRARDAELRKVMSASFGFGGTNNALVFGRIGDG